MLEAFATLADFEELDSEASGDDQWMLDEAVDPVDATVHFTGSSPPEESPEELYYQYRRAWRRYRTSVGKPFFTKDGPPYEMSCL